MKAAKTTMRDRDVARAPPAAGRHQRRPVAPAEPQFVAGEPGQCGGLAHAASTCSATSVRKVSSRLDGGLPGLVAQLVERALGDQPAAGDDADAVGHALGDFEDVRGHDDGAAGGDALAQHVLDLARGAGVEAGQRLVEDDELGVVHQRAGERHLLPHALGEAFAALVRVRAQGRASRSVRRARCSAARGSMRQSPATNSRYSNGVSLS